MVYLYSYIKKRGSIRIIQPTGRIIELVIIMTQVENSIIIIYTVYIYE